MTEREACKAAKVTKWDNKMTEWDNHPFKNLVM